MNNNKLPYAKAICYSGYRDGQDPDGGGFPSYHQVKQDLLILKDEWRVTATLWQRSTFYDYFRCH